MTIDEKIKLLKDMVKLCFPSHSDVLIDIEETLGEAPEADDETPTPGGYCLRVLDIDDAPIIDDLKGDAVEKLVDRAIHVVGTLADRTIKNSNDIANRLEMYRHPVEAAPEREGKKK